MRMKRGSVLLMLNSLLLGLCLAPAVWAQVVHGPGGSMHAPGVPGPPPVYPSEPGPANADQGWTRGKWAGDERPYLKIKADLDAALAHGTSAPALVARCKGPALTNQMDPKAQFAWAYATQLEVETEQGIPQNPALYGLRRAGAADCYPVARLRFLLTQELESNDDHLYLVPLAKRVLKRDPNDYHVRHAMIRALCSRPVGTAEALRLAEDDVERAPMNPERHRTLAGVYEDMYGDSRGHNATYRRKTIEEYEAYLKYAKPKDEFRPHAVQLIQVMKTEKPW